MIKKTKSYVIYEDGEIIDIIDLTEHGVRNFKKDNPDVELYLYKDDELIND